MGARCYCLRNPSTVECCTALLDSLIQRVHPIALTSVDQLRMCSLVNASSVLDQEYDVRLANGIQPMRNSNDSAPYKLSPNQSLGKQVILPIQ